MSFAPQHDWVAYESATAEANNAWFRSLSVSDRFAIYEDMFNLAWEARQNDQTGDWEALDALRWQEKVALRLKCVEAYRRMDETRNARAAATDAD